MKEFVSHGPGALLSLHGIYIQYMLFTLMWKYFIHHFILRFVYLTRTL